MVSAFFLVIAVIIPSSVFAGFDLGTTGNAVFWVGLLAWSVFAAAFVLEQKNTFVRWGNSLMQAFIPQRKRHPVSLPREAQTIPPRYVQPAIQKAVESPVVKTVTPVIKQPQQIAVLQPAPAITSSKEKHSMPSKPHALKRAHHAVVQHAREAVDIYKNAFYAIARTTQKKKKSEVLSPAPAEVAILKPDSAPKLHEPVSVVVAPVINNEVRVVSQEHAVPETEEVVLSVDEERPVESVAEEPQTEESHIVPIENMPQQISVDPVPQKPEMPVIDFGPTPEKVEHERIRDQALMRAKRAIHRSRNAQEGMEVVQMPHIVVPAPIEHLAIENNLLQDMPVVSSERHDSFEAISASAQSKAIDDEVARFRARVHAVESGRVAQRVEEKKQATTSAQVVHQVNHGHEEKHESVAAKDSHKSKGDENAPVKTKDVITLDLSSGSPKLVLTRHEI